MHRTNTTTQWGYTLIELLLYVTITGSLLIAASAFFGMSVDTRLKNQSIAEVNQQGLAAMELMAHTIRTASSITAPASGVSASQLTIAVPTASLSPTIMNVSGTTLHIKEGAAAAVALTNSKVQVTSLTFKNLTYSGTPGSVRISFVLKRLNPENNNAYDYQRTFTTTVSLRS